MRRQVITGTAFDPDKMSRTKTRGASAEGGLLAAAFRGSRRHVAMAVYGDISHDSRVQREAATLGAAGYRVTIVCLPGNGPPPELGASVDVLSHSPRASRVRPGSHSPFEAGDGVNPVKSTIERVAWLVGYIANLKAWGRWAVDQIYPDTWHAHDLPALEAISPALGKGGSHVYDSHELYLEAGAPARLPPPLRTLLRWRESRLIARTDAVITVNDAIGLELRRRYGVGATIVMNCPPRLEIARPGVMRQRLSLGDRPVIMYHGGTSPHRGVEAMIRALPMLPQETRFVVLGDGSLSAWLQSLAVNSPLAGQILWHPSVPIEELPSWIVDADVGIILFEPVELNNVLATPNKLFEYMGCGVPVVVSHFPELERVVRETGCGITTDPQRPQDVAAAVSELLVDPARRREMGLRGMAAAHDRYNWETQAERLRAVYDALP